MIAELDKKRKTTDKFVKGFGDNRHQSYVDYSIHQLLAQRVDSIKNNYFLTKTEPNKIINAAISLSENSIKNY